MNRRTSFITLGLCIALLLFQSIFNKALAQKPDSLSTVHIKFAVGADLSFLKMAEDHGTVFKDSGKVKPGLEIFREHGYNWIRLRLFYHPTRLPNDLSYTIAEAQAAKKLGFKFLLDYHYANSWADPGKQPTPKAWEGLSPNVLIDSVYAYTRNTIDAFRRAGVMPDMVQIGNEVRNGMLWPTGKLPEHWDTFAKLIQAGINGVDAGRGMSPRPLIMIHFDQGGNWALTKAFFDKLDSYGIRFDVIGLSYYPWWHGNLLDLRDNLLHIVKTYDKDVIVVETAYNHVPGEYLHKPAPFPETPQGQKEYLQSLVRTVLSVSSTKVKGIFWWEPAVVGGLGARGYFDKNGNALPVMDVFDKYTHY